VQLARLQQNSDWSHSPLVGTLNTYRWEKKNLWFSTVWSHVIYQTMSLPVTEQFWFLQTKRCGKILSKLQWYGLSGGENSWTIYLAILTRCTGTNRWIIMIAYASLLCIELHHLKSLCILAQCSYWLISADSGCRGDIHVSVVAGWSLHRDWTSVLLHFKTRKLWS